MGNYLLALRAPAPTPDEDEKNDPCYYDWTIPKWEPFKKEHNNHIRASQQSDSAKELKEALTSTVDMNSQKPYNMKSTSSSENNNANIQKVDYTRPHTVDQRKYGNMKDQAAMKAASNVHNVKSSKKPN